MCFDFRESDRKKAASRKRDEELVRSGAISALELSRRNSMFPVEMVRAARVIHDPSRKTRRNPSL